jgi:hypothetical protein
MVAVAKAAVMEVATVEVVMVAAAKAAVKEVATVEVVMVAAAMVTFEVVDPVRVAQTWSRAEVTAHPCFSRQARERYG